MANPDQKTILLEQAYDELKAICTKFQDESGATDMEVKTLLRELSRVYEKEIASKGTQEDGSGWFMFQGQSQTVVEPPQPEPGRGSARLRDHPLWRGI